MSCAAATHRRLRFVPVLLFPLLVLSFLPTGPPVVAPITPARSPLFSALTTFAEDRYHQFFQCPQQSLAPALPPDCLSLLALDSTITTALRAAVKLWDSRGLLSYASERLLFLQYAHQEDCIFAEKYGFQLTGNTGNVGIAAALEYLIKAARCPRLLFLERDWQPLPSAPLLRVVNDARTVLRNNPDVAVIYLRYQEGTMTKKCQQSAFANVFRQRHPCVQISPAYAASAVTLLFECAEQTLRRNFSRIQPCSGASESTGLYCFPARHTHWSNNPAVIDRQWALQHLVPNLPACPTLLPACLYTGVEFAEPLQCAVRRSPNKQFGVAVPGVFVHRDDSNTCPVPSAANALCPVGTLPRSRCGTSAPPCCAVHGGAGDTANFTMLSGYRFFAFSSQGWGRRGMGNRVSGQNWAKDRSEDTAALDAIVTWMKKINAASSAYHRFVLTPFFITASPDFAAMTATGCPSSPECQYREWNFANAKPEHFAFLNTSDVRPLYLDLLRERFWHPEYQGRTFFQNVDWASRLHRERRSAECFSNGTVCGEGVPVEYAAVRRDLGEWVRTGVQQFRDFWGYSPSVAAVPGGIGTCATAAALEAAGILAVDGATCKLASYRYFTNPCPPYRAFGILNMAPVNLETAQRTQDTFVLVDLPANTFVGQSALDIPGLRLEKLQTDLLRLKASRHGVPVFVTSSELHQLQWRGWSLETWPDGVTLRNFRATAVTVALPQAATEKLPLHSQATSNCIDTARISAVAICVATREHIALAPSCTIEISAVRCTPSN